MLSEAANVVTLFGQGYTCTGFTRQKGIETLAVLAAILLGQI